MDRVSILIRGVLSAFFTWLSAKFGALVPVMGILLLSMALDFATGWAASIVVGKPISSRTGGRGILKKVLYLAGVICGLVADWLAVTLAAGVGVDTVFQPVFGLLVAVWLVLNEMVSVLENLTRAGVQMPPFLLSVVGRLKIGVEERGQAAGKKPGS